MGTIRHIVLAALVATTPVMVLAQDNSAPPPLQDFRLDPSRDPNRPKAPERAGPEIGPQTTTTPAQETPPPVTATVAPPVVAPTVTTPRAMAPAARQAKEPTPQETVPAPTQEAATPVETTPVETAPTNTAVTPAVTDRPEVATETSSVLPWVAGGIVLVLLAGFFIWRRSNRKVEEPDVAPVVAPPPPRVPPVQRAKSVPPPPPVRTPPPPPPAVVHAVSATSPIALEFAPVQVRTSMVGAQVGYRLTLRNGSGAALDGLAVAAFMTNADAQHAQSLAAFFDDAFAPEAHRIAHLVSGTEIAVDGELRLDRIVPIQVEGRALLIPVVAFKVISLDGDELGRGAFIVGQESTPPRAKMGPFRLDQGPRQFRTVGSRPAQVTIPA
ncbi:hypothetical protein [Sphingobium sp. BS19]|uniref:hypothetical protein n=1 Tax=Sphingobium sp. BS19 TaxID=3018973 RepID=UPI0022ED97DC|nr:hypothetical protein [Sphingobium sp. BS19]GLI98920.1 hypothetical protein Sbs19_27380 [Sphingobium sp. BS19]